MRDLTKACEEAVKNGHAVRVGDGSTIMFTGEVDQEKMRKFSQRMNARLKILFEERQKKEIEAWKKWMREGPWFFRGLILRRN